MKKPCAKRGLAARRHIATWPVVFAALFLFVIRAGASGGNSAIVSSEITNQLGAISQQLSQLANLQKQLQALSGAVEQLSASEAMISNQLANLPKPQTLAPSPATQSAPGPANGKMQAQLDSVSASIVQAQIALDGLSNSVDANARSQSDMLLSVSNEIRAIHGLVENTVPDSSAKAPDSTPLPLPSHKMDYALGVLILLTLVVSLWNALARKPQAVAVDGRPAGDLLGLITSQLSAESTRTGELITAVQGDLKRLGESLQESKNLLVDIQSRTSHSNGDSEMDTAMMPKPAETPAPHFESPVERAFWPEPFLDNGKLAASRSRVLERVGAGDPAALALIVALGQLKLALTAVRTSQDSIVAALDNLGAVAYAFWKTEPEISSELIFDTAQSWGTELNTLLAASKTPVPLSVRIIMPKSGYDQATMLSERSLTGATSKVNEPMSWIVIGKSGDRQNVLVPGKVITE